MSQPWHSNDTCKAQSVGKNVVSINEARNNIGGGRKTISFCRSSFGFMHADSVFVIHKLICNIEIKNIL
jgi:hypothetical protein